MTSPPAPSNAAPLRAEGMRDLGPDDMDAFRRVERAFLEVTGAAGYREIRTPTIEPLHLFTSTAALAPQLLERVYSFLDWDGWSGERVVLRPDATVPAVRWYQERATTEAARLCYVQPVYRFESGGADRESWQCGVELFGLAAPEGDGELLSLARRFLGALELRDVTFELAHTGLVRAALQAAGLDREAQTDAYDRILEQEPGVADDLLQRYPEGSSALRLLFGVNGDARGYVANLRATLVPAVPAAASAVAELEAAAATLEGEGAAFRVVPATAGNFEYYSGLTFRARTGATEVLAGGRYDGLGEALGGRPAPASGFAADLLRLASLAGPSRAS